MAAGGQLVGNLCVACGLWVAEGQLEGSLWVQLSSPMILHLCQAPPFVLQYSHKALMKATGKIVKAGHSFSIFCTSRPSPPKHVTFSSEQSIETKRGKEEFLQVKKLWKYLTRKKIRNSFRNCGLFLCNFQGLSWMCNILKTTCRYSFLFRALFFCSYTCM